MTNFLLILKIDFLKTFFIESHDQFLLIQKFFSLNRFFIDCRIFFRPTESNDHFFINFTLKIDFSKNRVFIDYKNFLLNLMPNFLSILKIEFLMILKIDFLSTFFFNYSIFYQFFFK